MSTWTCTICTFAQTKPLSLQCEMCGNEKPFANNLSHPPEMDDANIARNDNTNPKSLSESNTMELDKNADQNDYNFDDSSNTNTPPSDNNTQQIMQFPSNEDNQEIDAVLQSNDDNSHSLTDQPQSTDTKQWHCVMCTFQNDLSCNYCTMCNGPSPKNNDLWGKRVCRLCNSINNSDAVNCKNCEEILTGIVDYDQSAKLTFIEDKKKSHKKAKSLPFYSNNNHSNHHKYDGFNDQYNGYHNGYNNDGFYDNYDDQYSDEYDEYNWSNYGGSNNSVSKNAKKSNKLKKKAKNLYNNPWFNSPFNNSSANMNNNGWNWNNSANASMNNNANNAGDWGGMNLFGGNAASQNDSKQQSEDAIPRANVSEEYEKAMKTNTVTRLRLIRRRQFVENDDGDKHFRICESQFMRSNARNMRFNQKMYGNAFNSKANEINKTITEVEYVINPTLIHKFEAKKTFLMKKYGYSDESKLNIVLGWHGTAKRNVDGIVTNNFDLTQLSKSSGDTGWYGSGIYFSEYASISMGYGQSLMLCKVILGKSYRLKTANKQNGRGLQNGYDSHLVVDQNHKQYGQEIVIFDVDQILPCYVVKY